VLRCPCLYLAIGPMLFADLRQHARMAAWDRSQMISPHRSTSLSVETWGSLLRPPRNSDRARWSPALHSPSREVRDVMADAVRVMCLQIASVALYCRVSRVHLNIWIVAEVKCTGVWNRLQMVSHR
jgi:hypothetical protein